MKITRQEVRELEDYIQRLEDGRETQYVVRNGPATGELAQWAFFAEHPHLLMPMGFDEYVAFANKREFQKFWFAKSVDDTGQSLYRRLNGQWWWLVLAPHNRHDRFIFHTKSTWSREIIRTFDAGEEEDQEALKISLRAVFDRLYAICDKWQDDPCTLWSPKLWTPNAQQNEKITLIKSVRTVLSALHSEKIDLKQVTWQQLEEIVAELLRAYGMEIHVVRKRPQGGRDILARGELIPGQEPMTIAVEVKHRAIVDRPEIETALWQNRAFPALLFATSGRFTAGVFTEKNRPENQLRLFLKDGVALGDMLKDYWKMRRWPRTP